MELGTFGAILGFAIELEQRAASFYAQAARGDLADLFAEMERGSRKRIERLERARREGVAEMILESIRGLDSESFAIELDPSAETPNLLKQAQKLEETCARFYQNASTKLPIREVVRLFQRFVEENQQRLDALSRITK